MVASVDPALVAAFEGLPPAGGLLERRSVVVNRSLSAGIALTEAIDADFALVDALVVRLARRDAEVQVGVALVPLL